MTRKQKRLAIIGGGVSVIAAAVLLVLFALQEQIVYFHSPSDVVEKQVGSGTRIRLGGLVEDGSVVRGQGSEVAFAVTDTANTVSVRYEGILPDLFREGQGVVVEGAFPQAGAPFVADTVLAKHDETYMPREVADSLKDKGVWQGE
ncbi:MAG: cytochrome c maturation protein CcmE [Alphaproteobacteria bacterium]|nr:cytochrome c maturation protein CcmE [Alphaproteobacteria bacterium]